MRGKDKEVIKVELPRELAERFRRYVAERYGLRRGAITQAIIDLIEERLARESVEAQGDVSPIVGLGLESGYAWEGEDLVEAMRRRLGVPDRR